MIYTDFKEKYVFWGLFVSLALAFTITPFVHSQIQILNIFILSSLALAVIAIGDTKARFMGGVMLCVPAIIFSLLSSLGMGTIFLIFFFGTTALFFIYVIFLLFKFIFSSSNVSTNTLLASICIYFSLAVVWAMFYGLIHIFIPESYGFGESDDTQNRINDLMYFSIVTLTTLGYGDIMPLSAPAKSVAAMEALVGQIYLTVLVARLVGLHIANNIHSA